MNILVVGATGYIGSELCSRAMSDVQVIGTSSSGESDLLYLDLSSPEQFDFTVLSKGDAVLFTAAISSPDICSNEHDRAWSVNVIGTYCFIEKAIERGARVIFFSSDTVYGECSETVDETSNRNPAGEYAEMKAEVEGRFLGNALFKAIRLSYVFSREDRFTKYLSGCSQRGEAADLFHPFYRAIVHREDVVDGVLALARRWDEFPQGVINFGGPEVLSRIDFAEFLGRHALPNLRFRVTEPEDEFFKSRPRVISMQSQILPALLGRSARTMEEAVRIEFDGK